MNVVTSQLKKSRLYNCFWRIVALLPALCLGSGIAETLSDQMGTLDIKLVLMRNRDGRREFLTGAELGTFVDIMKKVQPRIGVRPSKAPPERTWFYYWTYDADRNDLFRRVVAFSDEGHSVNWSVDQNTATMVRTLVRQVESRMQRREDGKAVDTTPRP